MSRVLFDLTDLIEWSGNLTGIQRVVYNIAIRIEKQLPNLTFVRFNSKKNKFTRSSLKELTLNSNSHLEARSNESNFLLKNKIRKSKVYAIGKQYLPLFVKKVIVQFVRSAIYTAKLVIDLPKRFNTTEDRELNIVELRDNDTLIIPGASWSSSGLLEFLAKEKLKKNILIQHFVYDLIPVLYPQFFGPGFGKHFAAYTFKMVEIGDSFVAISKSTKKDLEEFISKMRFNNKTVDVIRLGDEINLSKHKNTTFSTQEKPFFIAVGTFEVRKNYELIYQVYKLAYKKNINLPHVVIVGKQGWLTHDLKYKIEVDLEIEGKIILRDNVSDDELDYLYNDCILSIYPSHYEGWGLPVAESLSYGKLCLSSNTSSMPEIGGELIEYFDPNSPTALLKLLVKYTKNKDNIKKAESKIKSRYVPISWDKTADQYLKITKKLIAQT